MSRRRRFLCTIVLSLALAAPSLAGPGVRVDDLGGTTRVTLEGSWAGARYSVTRAAVGAAEVAVGERDALCTGDCYVLDSDALVGGTYAYTFDLTLADGRRQVMGPFEVTIGGRPAVGLSAVAHPNPLQERGLLRVTAALPLGARATDAGRATGLPGEVTLHDPQGRVLRTLWRGTLDRLTFEVPIAAHDGAERPLAPGVYLVVVRVGEHRSVSRLAVVR